MKTPRIWESPHPLRLLTRSHQPANRSHGSEDFFPLHRHDFYELGIVLGGECTWLVGRRRLKLRRGQAILIKSSSLHREDVPAGVACELAWLGIDFQGRAPAWAERVVSLGGDFEEIAASFGSIERERASDDPLTSLRVDLALQNVFLLVARQAEKRPRRNALRRPRLNAHQAQTIESAAAYFRRHAHDSVSVAQVSAAHSLCPAYFSTLFRAHFHVPPRVYVHRVKLEKARELLVTSNLTLKEISSRCGFVDATHFSKAFKRAHRVTPGAFRRHRATVAH